MRSIVVCYTHIAASFNSAFSMLADLILPDGCGTNNSHIRDWLLGMRNASSQQTHDACIVVARIVQSMGMKSTAAESAHVKLHVIVCEVNKAPHFDTTYTRQQCKQQQIKGGFHDTFPPCQSKIPMESCEIHQHAILSIDLNWYIETLLDFSCSLVPFSSALQPPLCQCRQHCSPVADFESLPRPLSFTTEYSHSDYGMLIPVSINDVILVLVYSSAVAGVQCDAQNANAVSLGFARSLSVILWSLPRLCCLCSVSPTGPITSDSPTIKCTGL